MHIHNNEILNRQSTHILLYEKYIFHIPITLLRPRNHDLSKCNILLGFFLYFTDGWRCRVSAETLSWICCCWWFATGHCSRTGNLVLIVMQCFVVVNITWAQITPRGAGVPPFRLCSSLVHSLPHLLLFITFSLFSFTLLIFFYCPSDPFLPELISCFQAWGCRRRPNLGLVCLWLCYLYWLVKIYSGVLLYLV